MSDTERLSPEREAQFRDWARTHDAVHPGELLAEIDALRQELSAGQKRITDLEWTARQLLSAVAGLKAGQPCHWLEKDWNRIRTVMGIEPAPHKHDFDEADGGCNECGLTEEELKKRGWA